MFLGLFLLGVGCFSQTDTSSVPVVEVNIPSVPESLQPKEKIIEKPDFIDVADVPPEYPGGMQNMYDFLAENVKYPEIALTEGYQGKVYIRFVVNEDGSLSNFSIAKGAHSSLNEEALRVIQSMPNWIPGEHQGKPAKVSYTMPINFMIHSDGKKDKKKKRKK